MQERTYLLIIPLIPLCLLACLAGMLFVVPLEFGRSPWDRFEVLVLPSDELVPEVVTALASAGERPLDRYSATVEIENFSGRLTIPVAAIRDHFEPDDPRFDPFLRALPQLFEGRSGEDRVSLIYLPGGGTSLGLRYLELSRVIGDYPFRLAGWDPLPALISGLAALILMVVAAAVARRRRWPVVLAILPVVMYAFAGGSAALVRGTMVAFAWALWQDRAVPAEREWLGYGILPLRRREYRHFLLALIIALVASLFTFRGEAPTDTIPAILAFLLLLAVLLLLSALALSLVSRRMAMTEHRLFIPRSILGEDRIVRPPRWALLLTGTVLLAAHAAIIGLVPPGDLTLPVPHRVMDEETVASRVLEEARLVLSEDYPLSTAGYLAHRRYQESLLFGGTFTVPAMDEVVALVRFARDGGRIRDFHEPVLTFDGEWVYRQLSPEPHSAYHLVVHEGSFLVFTRNSLTRKTLSPERLFFLLFVVIVGFGPLMYGLRLPYRSRIGTVGLASRSASQEA
ncbi:MAG: hypothetical protein EA427_13735 [Spirochaetaceae bacterium]|nr:MAG: hypothetical protein EA427_13735 [Spirochaetaceae bacterium]